MGGSCPDPPWAVLSGTALSLPLSGVKMLSSNSMLHVLGDSCAPASYPLPSGGGLCVTSQSSTPLLSRSWRCELMVMLFRFAPDCPSRLLCNCLGCTTFHFAITMLSLWSAGDCSAASELWVVHCSGKIIHCVNNLKGTSKKCKVLICSHKTTLKSTSMGLQQGM